MFTTVLLIGASALLAWAISNIALWYRKKAAAPSSEFYFWQMNALWNAVNAFIGIAMLLFALLQRSTINSNEDLQALLIKVVAVNILFDIVYIGAGIWLEAKGKKQQKDMFIGYGNSVQLQGAFLFCLDSMLALGLLIANL